MEALTSEKVSSHWLIGSSSSGTRLRSSSIQARALFRCCFTERYMPRQNSALFSNRELDQAGPRPSLLTV